MTGNKLDQNVLIDKGKAMIKYAIVKKGQKPSKKQVNEMEKIKDVEPCPDEESPELSLEDMERLRLAAIDRRNNRG